MKVRDFGAMRRRKRERKTSKLNEQEMNHVPTESGWNDHYCDGFICSGRRQRVLEMLCMAMRP
jgi:hypothetical protein